MYRITHKLLALAVVVTVAALGMWQATGAHPYTKYEDVTREQVRTDVDDPFVEAYRLGKKALGASRYTIAIRLLNQAAIVRPRDVELYYWLGVAYWNREQGEEAINSYRLAVELDADGSSEWSLYALENLAEVFTRTEQEEKARKTYRRAVDR